MSRKRCMFMIYENGCLRTSYTFNPCEKMFFFDLISWMTNQKKATSVIEIMSNFNRNLVSYRIFQFKFEILKIGVTPLRSDIQYFNFVQFTTFFSRDESFWVFIWKFLQDSIAKISRKHCMYIFFILEVFVYRALSIHSKNFLLRPCHLDSESKMSRSVIKIMSNFNCNFECRRIN